METVKVSSEGQVLIPKALWEACHITPGAELAIDIVGGEIHLKPAMPPITPTTVAAGRGLLASKGRKPLAESELKRRIAAKLKAQDAATKPLE